MAPSALADIELGSERRLGRTSSAGSRFQLDHVGAVLGELHEFLRRHRLREKVSLATGHPDLLQQFTLHFCFDALGHEVEAKAFGHGCRRPDNAERSARCRKAVDETAVNFEFVHGEVFEVAQRRIAGTKIIDG